MKKNYATISVIASGVLWGVISLFIKNMSSYGLDAMQITSIRLILAAVCFTLFVFLKDKQIFKIELKDIWMFIGTGIFSVVLFNCTYFYTMIHSQASVAVVLLYTSPAFVMILSTVFFKEKINLSKATALIMTFLGCVFVAGILDAGTKIKPFVIFTGICSGFLYALYTIFGRVALKKYDTMTVTAYTFISGAVFSIPIGKLRGAFEIVLKQPKLIVLCFGIGIISTVLPYFFYTWGLERMESGKAAILVAVEPVVGAVIGMTFFHESCDVKKIIGIILIVGAIIVLNISFFDIKKNHLIWLKIPKQEGEDSTFLI